MWRKTSTYTMRGPDGSDNTFEESTEPYFLTPPNTSSWTTFQTRAADTTLTIGDGTTTTAAFTVGSEEVVVITETVSDDIDDDADLTMPRRRAPAAPSPTPLPGAPEIPALVLCQVLTHRAAALPERETRGRVRRALAVGHLAPARDAADPPKTLRSGQADG